jgi:D-3-phosphoglycerate dehydrogenase / 2-oxoglutarate reductase
MDDIEEEPARQPEFRSRNPLFQLPNVIVMPHVVYYSEESIETVR